MISPSDQRNDRISRMDVKKLGSFQEELYEFTFQELKMIARNFSPRYLLFDGSTYSTYRGFIDDKCRPGLTAQRVEVTVFSDASESDKNDDWVKRVRGFLGHLRHQNLVKLIGYCCEDVHRILVCECMAYGSLENHLSKTIKVLPWSTRMNIALDAAKGLAFLHEAQTIYRDLEPSKILLDSDYTAKLSIVGVANAYLRGYNSVSTRLMGTYGYIDPEYIITGHLDAKSNVYSFGIVLLELLTGRKALDESRPYMEQNLVNYARPMLKDARKLARIMDSRLEGRYSKVGARKMAALAYQCLSSDTKERPTMSSVVQTLELISEITTQPSFFFFARNTTQPSVDTTPMETDIKKKSRHNQGPASSLETPITRYEVVLSCSDDQSKIIEPFIRKMLGVGISVFRNVGKVNELGNQTADDIYQAIKSSKICMPILSNQYLSSDRCLRELACIREVQRDSEAMQILPVFYDMHPCEVSSQYTSCMVELLDNELSTVQLWQRTLEDVVEIEGWEMKDKDFNKYINLIVNGILNKLKLEHPTVSFVRREDQIQEVKKSLDIESGSVLFVGIHGTSGAGKTSMAKFIFDELADQFEGCSFLHNIRETTENWGLKYLRDQLLRDIADKDIDHEEINRMEDKLLNKKVLIVLDDVNQREQINNLVGKGSWFGSGSRIIVTTQDPRVLAVEHDTIGNILKWPQEVRTCELRGLTAHASDLALQLFCKHAFGEDSPPYEYRDISISLLQAIGGLPLALEIIGSFLNRKPTDVWDSTLERLRDLPPLEVKEKLLISYESLEYETRQIFLDIACFFCNKDKTYPVYMWDACNFFPRQGLEVLMAMCLVKVGDDNILRMHDQVKEFGREMARIESFNKGLAWCSRLWVDEEALDNLNISYHDIIKDNMAIEALSLGCDESLQDWTFTTKSFGNTQNLRFLEFQGAHLAGNFKNHLQSLRWLQWHSCPAHCEATNLQLYNLVILDLSRSLLSHEWSGWSQLERSPRLKVLNLTSCKGLRRTPDFSSYTVLERLILEDCTNLVEVDESIGSLSQLKYLNLNGCTSLNALPRRIGELASLLNLEMDGTGVAELPFDIGRLVKLNHLVLSSCFRIEQLPSSLGLLALLVHLDLRRTKIAELSESIRNMKMLKVLKVEYSSITRLSKSIGMLERLEELHARHCEDLAGDVPDEFGCLSNLRMMDLSFSKIYSLPKTIKQLSRLQTLRLESCNELQELPELPESLVRLSISQNQPALLNWQRRITTWFSGTSIKNIRRWIGKLSKLETLELCIPKITKLELHATSQLSSLSLSCHDLELFPQFPASLSRLRISSLKEKTEMSTLGNMKKLTFLDFYDCSSINALRSLGVGQMESLEHLSATRCNFTRLNISNLPKRLRVLCLSGCQLLHELDLTGLINLIHLDITSCNKLKEIRGLGELLCLEEVSICSCDLLEKLGDLSNLVKLEGLKLNQCEKLKEVEGLDKIKSLKNLQICGCKSLENFHDKVGAKKQKLHLRIKA